MTSKNSRPPDDELTARLREAVRKKSPLSPWGVLIVLLCCGGPLAYLVWLAIPRTVPPPIVIVAFDECVAGGKEATVHAQALDDRNKKPIENVGTLELAFVEKKPSEPGKPPRQTLVQTDEHGVARTSWPMSLDGSEFLVRFVAADRRHPATDIARVHSFPAASSVLLVDMATLIVGPVKQLEAGQVKAVEGRPAAGPTLQSIAKERRIVYLADTDNAWTYRRMRAWMQAQFTKDLPTGPVLGRRPLLDNAMAMKGQFKGEVTAVVENPKIAAAFAGKGIQTMLLGSDEALAGVIHFKDWPGLKSKLPQGPLR